VRTALDLSCTERYGTAVTTSERTADRRQRILTAAASVFAEQGYAAASTAQIAAAAGASKETLYAYFGDKAGLLREALRSLVTAPDVSAAAPQVDETTSPRQFEALLRGLAAGLVGDLMQPAYLALARIVVAETPRDPCLADLFRGAVAGRALSSIATLLSAGQQHGLVDRDIDVPVAARAFVGPLLTYVLLDGLLRAAVDVRPPAEDVVQAQVALFQRSVRPAHHHEQETS
jgi:AcrR family transcriptional regulator